MKIGRKRYKEWNNLILKKRHVVPGRRETVEEFLARGGKINRLPPPWEKEKIAKLRKEESGE